MSNGNGNGNGDVQKLVTLKHGFKADLTTLEADLKAKFDQDLAAGQKGLKDKYLEQVVDWFYDNAPSTPEPVAATTKIVVGTTSETATMGMVKIGQSGDPTKFPLKAERRPIYGSCPSCNSPIWEPQAKFCSQCAAPLDEV